MDWIVRIEDHDDILYDLKAIFFALTAKRLTFPAKGGELSTVNVDLVNERVRDDVHYRSTVNKFKVSLH